MNELLRAELIADEGIVKKRYKCSEGYWTIGIGRNLQGKRLPGWLWNEIQADWPLCNNALLDDHVELTEDQVNRLFAEDVSDAEVTLDAIWVGWRELDEERRRALINLSFQMGLHRFLTFKRFWNAIRAHNFDQAALELQDSLWFRQTQPSRSSRVVRQIRG